MKVGRVNMHKINMVVDIRASTDDMFAERARLATLCTNERTYLLDRFEVC